MSEGKKQGREVFRVRADGSYFWPDLGGEKVTTDIHIPPAALEAGARAIAESLRTARLTLESEDGYKPEARAAFEAMLAAWPKWLDMDADPGAALILPLPQENTDDKA